MGLAFVFSQRTWPGAGDIDDCWCLASMQALDAVAPWSRLVGVKVFRDAAGKPDQPGSTPGDERDMAAGLRKLWPAIPVEVADGMTWATFVAKVRAGRPAALIGRCGDLPDAVRFGCGAEVIHAATVAFEAGEWLIDNPLAAPHSKPQPIAQSAVRAFSEGYKPNVHAVIMPTAGDAFRHHPFYADAIAGATVSATSVERARCVTIAGEAITTLGKIAQP